jgi:HTH-type transcriptional regulator/antitoxin HigA
MNNENNAGVDLDELLNIGGQMANVMFNLAQIPGERVSIAQAAIFDGLRKQWDAARRASASQISKDAGGEPVAQVVAGKYANRLEWLSDEAMAAVPVGTKLCAASAHATAVKTEQASAITPITASDEHAAALAEIERLIAIDPAPRTPDSDRLAILSVLVEKYEIEHFPLPSAAGAGSEQPGLKLDDSLRRQIIDDTNDTLKEQAATMLAQRKKIQRLEADLRAALARVPLPEQDDDARDAARYRWLVSNVRVGSLGFNDWWINADEPESEWNASIDAAMSASRPDDKAAEHDHSEGGHHD